MDEEAMNDDIMPVGIYFPDQPVVEEQWGNLHLRSSEEEKISGENSKPTIVAAMVPIYAQVLMTWLEMMERKSNVLVKKVVMIISGAGMPRNRALDIVSNSTKSSAEIMRIFTQRHYPKVETMLLDSGLGV